MPAGDWAGFGRRLRLLNAADFKPVFAQPLRSNDVCFTVLARRNNLDRPRLGLAVAKKHLRQAVARNRVKRLIRESFRLHQQQLAGFDLVVLARPGTASKRNAELSASLLEHWKRFSRSSK